jgi:hypothetical protein
LKNQLRTPVRTNSGAPWKAGTGKKAAARVLRADHAVNARVRAEEVDRNVVEAGAEGIAVVVLRNAANVAPNGLPRKAGKHGPAVKSVRLKRRDPKCGRSVSLIRNGCREEHGRHARNVRAVKTAQHVRIVRPGRIGQHGTNAPRERIAQQGRIDQLAKVVRFEKTGRPEPNDRPGARNLDRKNHVDADGHPNVPHRNNAHRETYRRRPLTTTIRSGPGCGSLRHRRAPASVIRKNHRLRKAGLPMSGGLAVAAADADAAMKLIPHQAKRIANLPFRKRAASSKRKMSSTTVSEQASTRPPPEGVPNHLQRGHARTIAVDDRHAANAPKGASGRLAAKAAAVAAANVRRDGKTRPLVRPSVSASRAAVAPAAKKFTAMRRQSCQWITATSPPGKKRSATCTCPRDGAEAEAGVPVAAIAAEARAAATEEAAVHAARRWIRRTIV